MTEKLYYFDAYITQFDATVVRTEMVAGRPAVVLDRTYFYPTSGGQPHDSGTLNEIPVEEVLLDAAGGEVLHILARPMEPGTPVHGHIQWERRFDHMQQHTGQHILSEAFIRLVGANTVSFHLSETYSSIDIDRPSLSEQDAQQVEELANRIIFENRPIIARFLTPEEVAQTPFRKPPAVNEHVRLVEIADFDWSACGGTHCRSTGEVGLLHIGGVEKRGKETRITFVCGWRALRDYRRKEAILHNISSFLTTGPDDLPDVVRKMSQELSDANRRLMRAHEELAGLEAVQMAAQAEAIGPYRVISHFFSNREMEMPAVKRLASQLLEGRDVVVLFAWAGGEKGQVLFGRSPDLNLDMNALLRAVCQRVGGGGGGRPDFAQGGGMPAEKLEEALALAREYLLKNK